MNSSPLAAIWHWYPLLAWVACARFCSLPLGSLSYLNFYRKLRLDSNFSYGTGLNRKPPSRNTVGLMRRMIQRLFVHGAIQSSCGYDCNLARCHVPLNDISLLILKTMLLDVTNEPPRRGGYDGFRLSPLPILRGLSTIPSGS